MKKKSKWNLFTDGLSDKYWLNKINKNKIYDLLLSVIYLLRYNLRAQSIIQHLSYRWSYNTICYMYLFYQNRNLSQSKLKLFSNTVTVYLHDHNLFIYFWTYNNKHIY